VKANQAEYATRRLCDLLGVSTSGYYAWLKRPESFRVVEDRALTDTILEVWRRSRRTYGAPRIHAELADQGIRVGRKRVARLMATAHIQGVTRRRKYRTTIRDNNSRPAPDLVERRFTAEGPNQIWVADITEIPTWEGPLYLAAVQDVWSRRIVGWAIEPHMRTELVTQALDMAISQRSPTRVVHHSDQGAQGGFNWSSQHLDDGGGSWRSSSISGCRRSGGCGGRSGLRGGLRRRGVSTGSGFGKRSLGVSQVRTLPRGWSKVVPRGWWDAASQVGSGVGPLSVVCRA
jgi:transposase InsO family protein